MVRAKMASVIAQWVSQGPRAPFRMADVFLLAGPRAHAIPCLTDVSVKGALQALLACLALYLALTIATTEASA